MKRKYTTEELMNKTFSYLTLVEHKTRRDPRGKLQHVWVCECVCGKRIDRRETFITGGHTTSCGCMHCRHNRTDKRSQWKGHGEITGNTWTMIKKNASVRDIPFEVTIEHGWSLFLAQNRLCALTGVPLVFSPLTDRKRGIEQTASLDRIDSNLGYVKGNVWWVHKDVNMMKKQYTLERFIEVCRQVTEKQAYRSSTSQVARTVAI